MYNSSKPSTKSTFQNRKKKKKDQDWIWTDKADFDEAEETANLNRKARQKITLSAKLNSDVKNAIKTGSLS